LRKLKLRRYTYDPAKSTLINPVDLITNVPANDDHGGGRLAFGPDQKLYLTRGDNGANWLANYCLPNRAQDLPTAAEIAAKDWSTYVGKILRIDLDGSIPADNPRSTASAAISTHTVTAILKGWHSGRQACFILPSTGPIPTMS
jgi:glucose/arabinose dehydrogenase